MEPVKKIEEGLKELFNVNAGKFERCPDVDVYDQGDNLLVMVDLPGVRKDLIKVKVFEKAIEILANASPMEVPGKPVMKERLSNFPISRKIELPYRLRVDTARAVYKEGVLQIVVGKAGELGATELAID